MSDLRRWIRWVGACAVLLLPGGAGAAQLELVSRSVPELRSETGMGLSTTDSFPDSSRFTYANPPRLSADGRWAVFTSAAPNLVEGQLDGNGSSDVFLHDRQTGTTLLVSRASGTTATTGSHGSFRPSISADGRYIAFLSWAVDLVPGQIDEAPFSFFDEQDVFLFDRVTGSTVLVSRKHGTAATGASGQGWDPFVSADGRFVAYLSSANDLISGQVDPSQSQDLFLYDRVAGTNRLVSHRNGSAQTTAGAAAFTISGNGEWIAFLSGADDIVPGQSDPNNEVGWGYDLFLYQVSSGAVALVTHASGSPTTTANTASTHTEIPSISADGSRLVFSSAATDLIAGITDTSSYQDVFLFDRTSGTTTLISAASGSPMVASGGVTPVISSDGTRIAFDSLEPLASGQTASEGDVYLYTVASGNLTLVSRSSGSPTSGGNAGSMNPSLSGDGTRVLFQSSATDLIPGQTDTEGSLDLFLADLSAGTLVLVNHASGSAVTPAAGPDGAISGAGAAFLSENGGFAAFFSRSDDLVPDLRDTNGQSDVFLYTAATAANQAVSVHAPSLASVTGNSHSFTQSMTPDGRFVVFVSKATDLVPGQIDQFPGSEDIFLEDRLTGEILLVSHIPGSLATTGDRPAHFAVISRDGSFVVFSSSATNLIPGQIDNNIDSDVFLYERASGLVTLLSHADGAPSSTGNSFSSGGLISGDGRYIAFASTATDLVPGLIETNGFFADIYLHDRIAGTTILVSRAAGSAATTGNEGSELRSLSADGRFLVFASYATNLIAGQIDPSDTQDIFLYDRISGTTTLVSHASGLPETAADASSSDAKISTNGGFIAFSSGASNLVPGQTSGGGNVYLFDRAAGTTAMVSHASDSLVTPAAGYAVAPTIDDNGDFVAFSSNAPNLVEGQIDQPPLPFEGDDIFLYDRGTATNILVSHIPGSVVTPANSLSSAPALSGNGAYVTYFSTATNLVAGNPPLTGVDTYVYNRLTRTTTLLSPASVPPIPPGFGPSPTSPQGPPLISQDGRTVVFASLASNLVAQDFNGVADVFRSSDPMAADFFILAPCRRLDTRQAGQGPALSSGARRTVPLHGSCGVPATARAVAVNVTVVQPSGSGYLTAFPGDFLIPPVVSTVNFAMGRTRTNNAIVSLSADGTLALQPLVGGGGTVHVVLDVFGYYE